MKVVKKKKKSVVNQRIRRHRLQTILGTQKIVVTAGDRFEDRNNWKIIIQKMAKGY